jgi:CarD family transcriptional regulator
VIETIQESLAEGSTNPCYQVRLIGNNSRVMVPVGNSDRIGLRPLTRRQEVGGVFRVLEDVVVIVGSSDWKGRYKQNLDKMRSGRLTDIADVLKNLSWVQKQKALSFREKKMYDARYLIVSEIAQVNGLSSRRSSAKSRRLSKRSMARKRPSGPKDH